VIPLAASVLPLANPGLAGGQGFMREPHARRKKVMPGKKFEAVPTVALNEHPHPLIAGWIERERQRRERQKQQKWPLSEFHTDTDQGRRVLNLYDLILKAGAARGYEAAIPKEDSFSFVIRERQVIWRIRPSCRREKAALTKEEIDKSGNRGPERTTKIVRHPTGNLALIYAAGGSDKRILDTIDQPLDRRIEEILDRFESAAADAAKREAEHREWLRRIDREDQLQSARETLVAGEKDRWRRLRGVAAASDEAKVLRETLELLRARLGETGFAKRPRTKAWFAWAARRIDELDPLSQSPEGIFERLIGKSAADLEFDWDE
jgi:hypothetical protein